MSVVDLPSSVSIVRARWSTAAVFFVTGGLLGSWAPHVPLVKARLALSDADLGIALLAMAGGAVVSMPFTGYVVARTGSAPVTAAAVILMALALPLVALAPTHGLLLAAAVLFGAGTGLSDVGMNAHAVEVERRVGRPIMSSLHGMFSVGGFVAAAAGGLSLSAAGPTIHAVAVALIMLAVLAVGLPGLLPGTVDRGASSAVLALPGRAVGLIAALVFIVFLTEGAMIDWSAVYLSGVLGAGPGLAAAGYAAFAGGMAIGRFAGDGIRASLSAPKLVAFGAAAAAVAFTVGVLSQSVPVAIAGLAVAGLGLSNVVPVLFGAAGRTPGVAPATGVAAVATTGYFGLLAGPPLIGFVAEATGLGTAFLMLAAACLGVAIFARAARHADNP